MMRMEGSNRQQETPRRTILLIDDNAGVRDVLTRLIMRLGYAVYSVADYQLAIELLQRDQGSLAGAIVDLGLPALHSDAMLSMLNELHPDLPLVVMNNFGTSGTQPQADGLAIAAVLQKPFSFDDLRAAMARAF